MAESAQQPNFNPERAARIEQRRQRIKQRLNEMQQVYQSPEQTQQYAEHIVQPAYYDIQVTNSLRLISDQKLNYASKLVQLSRKQEYESYYIFENDYKARDSRFAALKSEREKTAYVSNAFRLRFAALLDKDVQSLAAGLIELRQIAISALEERDVTISAFYTYLDMLDDDFLRIMRENSAYVDDIIYYSRKVARQLQADCEAEVLKCETEFDRGRAAFIYSNESELDTLRERAWQLETEKLDERVRLAEKYYLYVNYQILADYDEFTALKRRLEAEGVALRSQLEEMRSLYHLNADKLEYNYKLLASRDIESQNLIVENRKLIARLQNQLARVVQRFYQTDERLRAENYELSAGYRRLANVFCELYQKFKLFEAQDTRRFRELWAFHEQRIACHLRDLLLAEQIINESVVCAAPRREIDEQYMMSTIYTMLRRLEASAGIVEDAAHADAAAETAQQNLIDITRSINPIAACTVGQANATRLLLELAQRLSFMASDDLLAVLHPGEKPAPQHRTDALLSTLGVRNASELDLLFQHVTQGGSCQRLKERGEIVQALIEFASELEKRRDLAGNQNGRAEQRGGGIWSQKAVAQFWKEIAYIVSPEKATAWKLLEDALKRYQAVLRARADLVSRNDALAAQNEELRGLLYQYVDSERGADTGALAGSAADYRIPTAQGAAAHQKIAM